MSNKTRGRGARSAQAVLELERQGYTSIVNMGGIGRWSGPLVRQRTTSTILIRMDLTERNPIMKVIIVGGVAGGATAAARLRRLDENAEIIMIERSGYVSYANCGLPYYIGGTITDRSKLTLQTPQSFRKRFDIDARVRQEVVAIDRTARTVTVRRLDDGTEYVEGYDKLILSPAPAP